MESLTASGLGPFTDGRQQPCAIGKSVARLPSPRGSEGFARTGTTAGLSGGWLFWASVYAPKGARGRPAVWVREGGYTKGIILPKKEVHKLLCQKGQEIPWQDRNTVWHIQNDGQIRHRIRPEVWTKKHLQSVLGRVSATYSNNCAGTRGVGYWKNICGRIYASAVAYPDQGGGIGHHGLSEREEY